MGDRGEWQLVIIIQEAGGQTDRKHVSVTCGRENWWPVIKVQGKPRGIFYSRLLGGEGLIETGGLFELKLGA